jgi:DNA-binding SARP family transcriptional activator
MDRLEIRLLGSFQVIYGEIHLAGFESNKVRALLAYLAVEMHRPHPRRKLSALLWPEFPETTALSNLRYALSDLRKVIRDHSAHPPYLEISSQEIKFNVNSSSLVDVSAFERKCTLTRQNPLDFQNLNQAAELYRGSFLEGFSIPESIAFEEWLVLKREHFDRLAYQVFHRLAGDYELAGDYQQAISFAERQLELDPWREEAHRQIMRCLYFIGQRSAALAQYDACRRALASELQLEPNQETQRLYEQIFTDTLSAPSSPPAFFLRSATWTAERPRFVTRQDPLNRLHKALNQAMTGQGQLLLVTGSPGQGKTSLVQEFIRQAMEAHPALAAAWGNSHAYFGSGDPYLPFREILEMLTGEVEHRWEAGSITQDHACRLWRLTAYSGQALAQHGPALIGTFVPGLPLLQRASLIVQSEPSWIVGMRLLVDRTVTEPPPSQEDLFQQYWRVLTTIARHAPLLLFVDDLHWADQSSLGLLFHLSRQLSSTRILIVGAYRPFEGLLPSGAGYPSLADMVNELRLLHGDILINLDELSDRSFIDAYLDLEPNRFGETFREGLFRYTHSHPLFTIEILYGMQVRGDLIKNQQGEWVDSPSLNWDFLPPKVETAIAERLRNIPQQSLDLLKIASIEGERFTAEVAAKVQGMDEQQVIKILSTELDRRYKLIQADSSRGVNGRRLSRYRFRHILFQRYLYNQLDVVERARLHEQVGGVLEEHCSGMLWEIAIQLAHHFKLAGLREKEIHYLQLAGRQATRLSSFEDAIAHFNTALALLESQPETSDKRLQELDLLMYLSVPLMLGHGYGSSDLGPVCNRMVQLLNITTMKPGMFPIIHAIGSYYAMRAEYQKSLAFILQWVHMAESSGDDLFIHVLRWGIGYNSLWLGELREALSQSEKMIDFYDSHEHRELHHILGSDPGISSLCWSSWALWLLGYADKALARGRQAVELSRALGDPQCQLFAQELMAFLHMLLREPDEANELIQSCSYLLAQNAMSLFAADVEFLRGVYQVQKGEPDTGLGSISRSLEALRTIGVRNMDSLRFTLQAEANLRCGQVEQATHVLQLAEDFIAETGERFYQAETLRLKGETLLHKSSSRSVEAESCFYQALQVAGAQEAKSLELRAAVSLAHLWQNQGRLAEARRVLAEVYSWFTEGFDTLDLKEARALLETLTVNHKPR